MDASHWDRSFPIVLTSLPSTADVLKFSVFCHLHDIAFTSIADVDEHIVLSHTATSQRLEWQCGHCASYFARDLSIRQHIRRRHVRLATAKYASFADKACTQNVNSLFSPSEYVFPRTCLQTLAGKPSIDPRLHSYNALQNCAASDIFNFGAEAMALNLGLPCEHGPTRLKHRYMALLAKEPVRSDLFDDLDIKGIPGQMPSISARMPLPLFTSIAANTNSASKTDINGTEPCNNLLASSLPTAADGILLPSICLTAKSVIDCDNKY